MLNIRSRGNDAKQIKSSSSMSFPLDESNFFDDSLGNEALVDDEVNDGPVDELKEDPRCVVDDGSAND
jgi:hypothetical protein